MEVVSLRLIVTEADLNELASRICSWPDAIRNVRFAVIPEGIRVSGTYETGVGIPFQMLWQVSVSEEKVVARLGKLKAGFLSLGWVKHYLLQAIAAATTILELRDETLVFDVDVLLQGQGLPLRTHLTSLRCDYASLTVESG
jgi:hypothetical protein